MLPYDYSRCHAVNCERRDECERYKQRNTGGEWTPHVEHMCSDDWFWFMPVERQEGE